jgi:hypothetical protein
MDSELRDFLEELPMDDPNDWVSSYLESSENGVGQIIYRRVFLTSWKIAPLP